MAENKAKPAGGEKNPDNNAVGRNNEYNALSLRRSYLRERCADEIGSYMHLSTCVAENLRTEYMVRLGQFECRVFSLNIELARWQRRFTLLQIALNRGEKPDFMAIETQLDKEFGAYLEKIEENDKRIRDAAAHASMERMPEADAITLRTDYINAVKRLHPDLNPGLSESATALWHKIQSAYSEKDWPALGFLLGLVDDVLGGRHEISGAPGGLEELRREIAGLEERLDALRMRTEMLTAEEPFIWRDLLRDRGEVSLRRTKLDEKIRQLTSKIAEYETRWNGRRAA